MADQYVQLPSDASNTGKKLDHSELTVNAQTVERQRLVVADDATAAALAKVLNSAPAGTEYALVVRNVPSGTQTVSGSGTFTTADSQVLADNAGFTDGTSKVFPIGAIYDESAGTALTENDVAAPRINVNRSFVNVIEDGTTRGRYATVTSANALKVDPTFANTSSGTTALGALNAAVSISVSGMDGASLELDASGTLVGTIVFEGTVDGTNWFALPALRVADGARYLAWTSASGAGAERFHFGATSTFAQVRARVSAFTSGTRNSRVTATNIADLVRVSSLPKALTYSAGFRAAETTATLSTSFTHVANTNKQYATIYHASSSLKTVRLQYVAFYLWSASAAIDGVLELRRLSATTAPVAGTGVAITPAAMDSSTVAADATCLYLPGTQGSETAGSSVAGSLNSPLFHIGINQGITTTPTTNAMSTPFVLFDARTYGEIQAPSIRAGVAEGFAVMLRTVGTPAVKATVEIIFTEE